MRPRIAALLIATHMFCAVLGLLASRWMYRPKPGLPSATVAIPAPPASILPNTTSETPTPHSSFEYLIGPQGVSIKRFVGKETFVKIPDTFEGHPVVTIDSDSFKGLRGITGVVFPKTTTTIFNMTFAGCTDLRSLNLPPQLTHIGFRAFEDCPGLKEVRIPASVEQIGLGCFHGSTNITAIVVDPANRKYKSWDGVLYDKNTTRLIACPLGKSGVLTIPGSVKAIEGYAFLAATT